MSGFKIVKKGYEAAEVDAAFESLSAMLAEKDGEIKALTKRTEAVERAEEQRKKESEAIVAETKRFANELKDRAKRYFEDELSKLRLFRDKWRRFAAAAVNELAPVQAQKTIEVGRKLESILLAYEVSLGIKQTDEAQPAVLPPAPSLEKLAGRADKAAAKAGQPNRQMTEPPAAVKTAPPQAPADGGEITAEEILNVKESLADLCKELGL